MSGWLPQLIFENTNFLFSVFAGTPYIKKSWVSPVKMKMMHLGDPFNYSCGFLKNEAPIIKGHITVAFIITYKLEMADCS